MNLIGSKTRKILRQALKVTDSAKPGRVVFYEKMFFYFVGDVLGGSGTAKNNDFA